jgi:hypothetical protein
MMVVLDTNFITLPTQFGVDIFGEIRDRIPDAEFVTVSQAVKELERLKGGKVGLEMLKKFKVKIVETEGDTDDALLNLAIRGQGLLCTNDHELKMRALERKVPVMFMRKKKILEISGGLDV